MSSVIKIHCKNNNSFLQFSKGVTLLEVYSQFKLSSPYPILGAKVDNKLKNLQYEVYRSCDVEYIDYTSSVGMRVYVHSLAFVLSKAVHDLYPSANLRIEYPISNGYYCLLHGLDHLPSDYVQRIKLRMQQIIAADLPFEEYEARSEEVIAIFRGRSMEDKALLLETTHLPYATYYKMGDYIDFFYSILLPSSGAIELFDLHSYRSGMFLQVPSKNNPHQLAEFVDSQLFFNVFKQNNDFQSLLKINNVGDLNRQIISKQVGISIKVAEALHEKRIAHIADDIVAREQPVRVVLISGPSSSGKTTFSKRLSIQLMAIGLEPKLISIDNYYVNRDQTPLDEDGQTDFESLYAVDIQQLNRDLSSLINGETISLPTYNFERGIREYKGDELSLSDNSILILEGIHALNPLLTPTIDNHQKYKIYVSALTTLSLDDHNWISTTDNRLLRRIVRDDKYRAYSAENTILRWPSVRKGEEKWIFPYQDQADAMFNSALIFELSVFRNRAIPLLLEVHRDSEAYSEAYRLLHFLYYLHPLNMQQIPPTSLLREFLGGSSFKY